MGKRLPRTYSARGGTPTVWPKGQALPLTVRISDAARDALRAAAQRTGMSASDVVETLIRLFGERVPVAHDIGKADR